MVVNNSGEGRNSDGTLKNDDGDGMVESVIQAGSEYTWDVSFDSSNVPDGPAEIHVVVFDKAGKSRHGSIEARFSNNAPRITSVKFGTDLDGNGSVSASEETTFYAYKDNDGDPDTTKGREIWNLEPRKETESIDRDWLIRSTLEVTPEFVGGTAPFYYVFSKKNSVEADTAGSRLKDAEAKTVSGVKSGNLSSSGTTITFSDDDLGNSGDGSLNTYRFSFWDSTEETTIGVDSGACVLNAELKQVMNDTTPPIAYVHPFFWNGKKTGNNSVHWNGNTPLGHIELVEDLTSDITGATDGSSGTLGSDPKVSGTIVIRGTAYDETKLKKVKVAFDGIIDSGVESELQNSGWSTAGSLETNGYELTVTELKLSQTGHLVSWELKIDTSKISGQTGINKSVKVTAYDSKNNYNTVGSETVTENESYYATEEQASKDWFYTEAAHSRTPEANKKEIFDRKIVKGEVALSADDSNDAVYKYTVYGTSDKYQMDIVPYVTEVVTNLSAMKTTNPSVNSRTANGHYPVQSVFSTTVAPKMSNKTSEDVVLHGFNLGGTLKVGNISSSTIQTASGAKKAGELCFNVASLKSGKATITVNGIPVMNNLNDNDSMGTCTEAGTNYANCYNRTPNGENNNLLTDDIEFDVWEFNDRVAKVSSVGFMYNVRMMINQTNKILQYIFATSDKDVYIGNGTKSSNYYNRNAQNKDYITTQSLGFYVDSSGNTYGTWLSAEDTDYYYYVNNNGTKVSIATINGVTNNLKDQIYSPVFAKRANVLYHAYFDKLDQKAKFIDTINHKIVQNLEDTVWGRANNLSLSSTFYKSANGAANSRNNDKYTKPNNGTAVELTGKTQYLNNTTVYEYKYKYTKTTGDDSTVNLSASNAIALSDLETEDNSANSADSYVNLAVTKTKGADTDTVLAVWYSQSGKLFYSYKENAESTGGWSQKAKTIFGDGGKYCAIAVDAHGGVHIAAYVGKDLKYAYSSSYDGEFTTCIVDTNSGNHLTLDVALEEIITGEFRPIPVIGYYSGKQKPKFAKLNHEAWINSSNSVDSESSWSAPDAFTSSTVNGKWENSFVPVRTNLLMQEEEVINVGLWKNTEGKLTNSYKTGTTVGTSTYDNSSSETYGNGSSNGILCYITDNGSNMETAQMRGSN